MKITILSVRFSFAVLLLASSLSACKKDDDNENTKTFEIQEGGTKIPLSSVQVKGFKCHERDFLGNCLNEAYVSTTTSDERGIASFPKAAEVSIIKVSKDKYWDNLNYFHLASSSVTYLYPKATLKVRFTKINQYTGGEKLVVIDQSGPIWDENSLSRVLGLPADTIVYLKGRGNFENRVNWIVMDQGGNGAGNFSPGKMVNRFDTTAFEIQY